MTISKGAIQGYNGIAINDDKHQIHKPGGQLVNNKA